MNDETQRTTRLDPQMTQMPQMTAKHWMIFLLCRFVDAIIHRVLRIDWPYTYDRWGWWLRERIVAFVDHDPEACRIELRNWVAGSDCFLEHCFDLPCTRGDRPFGESWSCGKCNTTGKLPPLPELPELSAPADDDDIPF